MSSLVLLTLTLTLTLTLSRWGGAPRDAAHSLEPRSLLHGEGEGEGAGEGEGEGEGTNGHVSLYLFTCSISCIDLACLRYSSISNELYWQTGAFRRCAANP